MVGYIIASVLTTFSNNNNTCFGLLCWRWSFLIEVILLSPLYLGLYFIPKEDIAVCAGRVQLHHAEPTLAVSYDTTVVPTESSIAVEGRNAPGEVLQRGDVETGTVNYKSPERNRPGNSNAVTVRKWCVFSSNSELQTNSLFMSASSHLQPASVSKQSHHHHHHHMTPEERQQFSALRQTAMSASLYDPLSTRYAFKKSCDNLASLGGCQ